MNIPTESFPEHPTDDAYTAGWNDKIHGRTFLVYRSSGGAILLNLASLAGVPWWTEARRADYVRGWEEASAKILTLAKRGVR